MPPAPEPPLPATIHSRAQVYPQSENRPGRAQTGRMMGQDEGPLNIDWGTILLWLLAIIAVGGLIPLYLWVFFLYQ